MRKKRGISFLTGMLVGAVLFGGTVVTNAAHAAGEHDTAVAYLVEQGIYEGDANGNLNLEQSLTRAELAAILTRLDFAAGIGGLAEWQEWGEARFRDPENQYNPFTDLPDWALPYVEYCYQLQYMVGVADGRFDPQGMVNPQMAATVMLRYCRIAETEWSYGTSVTKAQEIGIAPTVGMSGNTINRATMALLIYNSIQYTNANASVLTPLPEPVPDTPQPEQPAEPTNSMTIEEMRLEIVRLTNLERVSNGLPELEILPELMECAQAKADDMAENSYYGHISPVYGTPGEMILLYVPQARSAGENIAPWRETPQEVVEGWMGSDGHRGNILATKYTHIGVGIIEGLNGGYWWVQQFVAL